MGTYENNGGALGLIAGAILYAENPIGSIVAFGGSTAPTGWMLCQGQAVSRTEYADLFAVIGTNFGVGDGSTTFELPDMCEVVPVGAGTSSRSGISTHDTYSVGTFKDDQLQNITGGVSEFVMHSGQHTTASGAFTSLQNGTTQRESINDGNIPNKTLEFDASGVARTGATTHGKQLGVNFIIKSKQTGLPADLQKAIDDMNILTYGG